MRLIETTVHDSYKEMSSQIIFERIAARAIVIEGEDILMIYTKRYNDYSFPGGGVDKGEDIKTGLYRELSEETGAENISVISEFGSFEEYRPSYYDGYDIVHMMSYFYICSANKVLGKSNPESYEIKNGSVPVWVNIHKAILHNEAVMLAKEDSMGLSIARETMVLKMVVDELL
ncbi:MAG: NUDIX domain-containing protein [Acidaminobacteraceae bacterium]